MPSHHRDTLLACTGFRIIRRNHPCHALVDADAASPMEEAGADQPWLLVSDLIGEARPVAGLLSLLVVLSDCVHRPDRALASSRIPTEQQ
jgi:hypothetical protein